MPGQAMERVFWDEDLNCLRQEIDIETTSLSNGKKWTNLRKRQDYSWIVTKAK